MSISDRVTWHLEVDPYDPQTGATVVVNGQSGVRATTAKEWNTGSGDTPASTIYEPGLRVDGFGSSILDANGNLGGVLESKLGTVSIPNSHAAYDALLRCTWAGRTATVYRVEANAAHSTRAVELKGYVSAVTLGQTEIRLSLESYNSKLMQKPVQPTKFWGRPRALRATGAGSNQTVSFGDVRDVTGSFTIECLYRMNGTSGGATAPVFAKDDGATTGCWAIFHQSAGNFLRFIIRGGHGFNTSAQNLSEWHWYSFVYDTANNTASIYVDGAINNTTAATVDPVNNTATLRMLGDGGTTNVCNGDLAEVRFWNIARSQEDVQRTMYGGVSRSDNGLLFWFRGNPGSDATANDEAYGPTNGTITGATWIGTLEGDEALGGVYKPWAVGQPYYAEPVLIDSQKNIWQACSRGFDPNSVPILTDGGSAVSLNATPEPADIWAGTVSAGTFTYDAVRGLIRPGSSPALKFGLTFRAAPYTGIDTRYPPGALKAIVCESAGFVSGDFSVENEDFQGFFGQVGEVVFIDEVGANASTDSAGDISASIPAVAQVGDLLLLFGAGHSDGGSPYVDWTFGTPVRTGGSGVWTAIINGVANSGGIAAHRLYAWQKTMTSGETSVAVPVATGQVSNRNISLLVLRGQNGSTPIVTSAETSPDSADNTAPAPDVTSTSDGDLLACGWSSANGADFSQPAGMIQDSNLSQSGGTNGNRSTLKVAHESRPTAGSTGTRTITLSASRHVGISVIVGIQLSGTPVLAAALGLYVKDGGLQCSDAVAQIAASYRAFAGFDYDGIFKAKDMTKDRVPSASAQDLTEDDVEELVVSGQIPLVKEVQGEWRPYWPPLQASELALSLSLETKRDLQMPFRKRRFVQTEDRFGRPISNYFDDAQEDGLRTLLNEEWAASKATRQMLDFRNGLIPIWRCIVKERSKFPKVGDTVTITHSRLGLSLPVKCIVVSSSKTLRGDKPLLSVDLADAASIAVAAEG